MIRNAARTIAAACLALMVTVAPAQAQDAKRYEANWASINSRPTPEWWLDAKFGIFIHWGVYSVPAYAPNREYAEWYWELQRGSAKGDYSPRAQETRTKIRAFHDRVYGKDFDYPDFAPQFKAELFDADRWAQTFKDAGARYIVLVSKHHDGFAMWPSKEASRTWGRPWNSAEIGPKRDVAKELTTAVRYRGMEMGFYYSLYEWFNPLYLKGDVDAYVTQHMEPQFKDLVERYQPSVIFSDGEWDHPSAAWQSPRILSWLLNDSPVKDRVVINDRWGAETRHKHGGYYTTEYGAGLAGASHPWEESRGIAYSYGYNRNENLEDYATGQKLLLTLIDTVSRGGNFLLDVGPDADGQIPVVMQDRLSYVGRWLKYNGEAIYGTRTFRDGAQWSSDGAQPSLDFSTHFRSGYDVEKVTIAPDRGDARKEVLFTRKGEALYAIMPIYPEGQLVLRDLNLPKNGKVAILGSPHRSVKFVNSGSDLVIDLPKIIVGSLPFDGAYVVKLTGLADLK